jgi:hypothetical protein
MCELLCESSLLANSVNGQGYDRSAADLTAQDHGQSAAQYKVTIACEIVVC